MTNTLVVFSSIINHQVFLTGYDDYLHCRSRNIATYEDLAEELNENEIFTSRGTPWTTNSLKCFISRCLRKHTADEIAECCQIDLIGSLPWEFPFSEHRSKHRNGLNLPSASRVKKYEKSLHSYDTL